MDSDPTGTGRDWASPGGSAPPPGWSTDQPPAAPQTGWGAPYAPPPPPRPGIIPLRPLGVGEILDGSFTAIRRYPRPTLGLAACVMLVVTVVQVLTEWYLLGGIEAPGRNENLSQAGDYLSRVGTASAVSFLVTALATLLLTGLVTAVIGEGVLGRPVTAADAWARLRPLFWRLVGVALLTFVIIIAVAVAATLPGFIVLAVGSDAGGGALLAIGAIAAAVVDVWLYVSLSLAPAALVLERQTVRGALRRSRALVRGSWWRVFGILLLAAVIASVVSGIISLPFGLAGGGLTSLGNRTSSVDFAQLALAGVGNLLAATVVRPFSAGVAALLYIDRRMRAEALDATLAQTAAQAMAQPAAE